MNQNPALDFLSIEVVRLHRLHLFAAYTRAKVEEPFLNNWNFLFEQAANTYGAGKAICAEMHLKREGKLQFLGDLPTRGAPYKDGVPLRGDQSLH